MSKCSNCDTCSGSKKDCKDSCDKNGCDGSCCDGKCDNQSVCKDCEKKYEAALKEAAANNGMNCIICKTFTQYAEPNRCNGNFVCFKCKNTKAWQLPKGKWK